MASMGSSCFGVQLSLLRSCRLPAYASLLSVSRRNCQILCRRFSQQSAAVIPQRKSIRCNGCGTKLQSRDQAAAGYIPSLKRLELLEKRAEELLAQRAMDGLPEPATFSSHGVICQRCFSAKHYGRLMPLDLPAEDYAAYLSALKSSPNLIVWVVDVLDFHGGLVPHMCKQLLSRPLVQHAGAASGKKQYAPLLLVLNKIDLIPHTEPFSRIEAWTSKQLKLAGLHPHRALCGRGLHLVSASRGIGIPGLLRDIRENAKGADVYVAGVPNAGKSSVINALLEEAWGVDLTWTGSAQAGAAAKRKGQGVSATDASLVLDELPDGYSLGDAFTGDVRSLRSSALSAPSSSQPEKEEQGTEVDSTGTVDSPIRRRGATYGSAAEGSPQERAEAASHASAAAAMLAAEENKKLRHRDSKGEDTSELEQKLQRLEDMQLQARLEAERAAAASGSISKSSGGRAAPPVPFTVSPLPGTTLGVVGAALDAHGHVTLCDTPGLVVDKGMQRVLEGVATLAEAEQKRLAQLSLRGTGASDAPDEAEGEGEGEGEGQGKRAKMTSGERHKAAKRAHRQGPAKSAATALQLLVPSKRPSFETYRLTPGRTLWLGGLARLTWHHPDERQHILLTVASRLPVHCSQDAAAHELWQGHVKDDSTGLLWPRLVEPALSASVQLTDCIPTVLAQRALLSLGLPWPPAQTISAGSVEPMLLDVQKFIDDESGGPELDRMEGPLRGTRRAGAERNAALPVADNVPPGALLPTANEGATVARRQKRHRVSVVDVVFRGLGWLAVTPIEVQGLVGWARTLAHGSLALHTCEGIRVQVRDPLLPYLVSGLRSEEFKT